MPQEVFRQANMTGGELDPRCLGRRDLKAYGSSLALTENHLPMPQGPLRRRPGLAHVDLVRNQLEPVSIEAATVTAPNGGTAADLKAGTGMVTTTPVGTTDEYVVAEVDFGAPVEIALVDLIDVAFDPDGSGGGTAPGHDYPWWKFEEAP